MSDANDSSDESTPFFYFDRYANGVKNEIKNINYSNLPKYKNKPLSEIRKDLIKMIDDTPEKDLLSLDRPNQELDKFFNNTSSLVFDEEILHQILNVFPFSLPMAHQSNISKKEIKYFTLYFISIIQGSKYPLKALHYIISHFIVQTWHRNKSQNIDSVKNFCLCRNKKDSPLVTNSKGKNKKKEGDINPSCYTDYTWIIADKNKKLYIYKVTSGKASNQIQQPYTKLKEEKGMIKVFYYDELVQKLYPVNKNQTEHFLSQIDFPNLFLAMPSYVPFEIYKALYQAITNDDLLILRAVAHFSVTKVTEGLDLSEALFKIFAYANKTHALLSTLVGMEFENPSLTNEKILRVNSHLTNTFKIINRKYGQVYFEKVVRPIVKYVLKKGNIGLKDPNKANEKEAKIMLFTVIKYILSSAEYVPPQIRHVILLLRSFSGIRFNNYRSTYNAISGYFFLRFFSSMMVDPSIFDPNLVIDEETTSTVIMPFIQLLQTVLNLKLIKGKMSCFSSWNDRIEKHVFPKLIKFAFSLAEIEENPKYEPPTHDELQQSLRILLNIICDNHEKFQNRYNELKCIKSENYPPVGWCYGSFLCEFFANYDEVHQ